MPLKAILDIVLHFESFRNIDLYHFGVYSIKTTIYQIDKNQNVLNNLVLFLTKKNKTENYLCSPLYYHKRSQR